MASRKLPLAEFLATVKKTDKRLYFGETINGEPRYGPTTDDPDRNRDASQQLIVTLVIQDPEDIVRMDALTNGKQGLAVLAFRCFSKNEFKRSRCDPNQPLVDEPGPDDELARLRVEHRALITAMKGEGGAPAGSAPDSASA